MADGASQNSCQYVDSTDRPTDSSSSLNLWRRSAPPKERSYDGIFTTPAPVGRLVPGDRVRRRNTGPDIAVGRTVVPYGDVDGNADDRPRGRAEYVRRRDVGICPGGRNESADV